MDPKAPRAPRRPCDTFVAPFPRLLAPLHAHVTPAASLYFFVHEISIAVKRGNAVFYCYDTSVQVGALIMYID